MTKKSLIVNNLTAKWQAQTILSDINFELPYGGHLLITGNSGSGKTSLAKALAGKLFYSGTINWCDKNNQSISTKLLFVEQHYHFKNRSNVSSFYYQQRFNSFDGDDAATVFEELNKAAVALSVDSEEIENLLLKFDLHHRSESPLLHLSSGEHKRFQLVKALLQAPEVIIFDEPFIGLDIQTREILRQCINDIAANGTTVIIICKPTDAPDIITHAALLEKGSLIQFGRLEQSSVMEANHHQHASASLPQQPPVKHYSTIVDFKNVSVSYGSRQILNAINWKVDAGEKWLLKGRNGVGKSTLLSLITGDNPQAYANEIYLFGKRRGSGESIWDIKKNIGYVSPELQWYFDTSVSCFQAVASGFFDTIGLFRPLNVIQQKQANDWLNYFELTTSTNQLLSSLPASKQRLALLARAMVKNPPVLILDEPCQGLDQYQKDYFLDITQSVCTADRTLIYVSHYKEDVPACIEQVLELDNGNAFTYQYN